jgi:hypothetical protein
VISAAVEVVAVAVAVLAAWVQHPTVNSTALARRTVPNSTSFVMAVRDVDRDLAYIWRVRVCWRPLRPVIALLVCAALPACASSGPPLATAPTLPIPPPAVSSIDHTVSIRWYIPDSFDHAAAGTCPGRDDNDGIRGGALVRFHGQSTGFDDETTTTSRYERRVVSARSAAFDSGQSCSVQAVFAPTMPDPSGYLITFPGTEAPEQDTGVMSGRTPFGMADEPLGYGSLNIVVQHRCPTLTAPPEQDCPTPPN